LDLQQAVDKPVVPVAKGKWSVPVGVALVRPAAAEAVGVATDHTAVQVVSNQEMLVV